MFHFKSLNPLSIEVRDFRTDAAATHRELQSLHIQYRPGHVRDRVGVPSIGTGATFSLCVHGPFRTNSATGVCLNTMLRDRLPFIILFKSWRSTKQQRG